MKKITAGLIVGIIIATYGVALAATTILPVAQGGTGARVLGPLLQVTSGILQTCIPRSLEIIATSTAWQAGTTTRHEIVPAAFTLKNVVAKTLPAGTTQFFNLQFGSGTASTTMLQASSTANTNAFTANNTFATGTQMFIDYGTTTAPLSL